MTWPDVVCLWVGRLVLLAGGVTLAACIVAALCDKAFWYMRCSKEFMAFLRDRHRRRAEEGKQEGVEP